MFKRSRLALTFFSVLTAGLAQAQRVTLAFNDAHHKASAVADSAKRGEGALFKGLIG